MGGVSRLGGVRDSLLRVGDVCTLTTVTVLLTLHVILKFFTGDALPFFKGGMGLDTTFLPVTMANMVFKPVPTTVINTLKSVLSFVVTPANTCFPNFAVGNFVANFVCNVFLCGGGMAPLEIILT